MRPAPGVYVKDLQIIDDRDLKDLIIVDNSIISFAFNLANGVPIKAFVGEGNDEELLYMVTFLEEIFSIQDVRGHIEKTFKLKSMMSKYGKSKIKGSEKKAIMQNAKASLYVKNTKTSKQDEESKIGN